MRKLGNVYFLILILVGFVSYSVVADEPPANSEHSAGKSVPAFRPTSNPTLQGIIVVKPVNEKEDAAYLRITGSGKETKDYLIVFCQQTDAGIEVDNEACRKSVNACKSGDSCIIRGKVDELAATITAEFVRVGTEISVDAGTKVTKTGQVFTRDTCNPRLGEAWQDPSGMIWSDIAKKYDGTPRFLTLAGAEKYCKDLGAKLPSVHDFIRLRGYMGAKSGSSEGYLPQIFSEVKYRANEEPMSRYYITSSLLPGYRDRVYSFGGFNGEIDWGYCDAGNVGLVRCVVERP